MRGTLIIDGYNAIHKIPPLRAVLDDELMKARNALAAWICRWKHDHRFHGDVIIVFDGKDAMGARDCMIHGIRCLFSSSHDRADNVIIGLLKSGGPYTVITDDNYIRNHCRVYHATHKPVALLMTEKQRPSVRRTSPRTPAAGRSERSMSLAAQRDITAFLKKQWNIE